MLLSRVSQLRNSREFGNVALAGSGPSVWKEGPEITSLASLQESFWSGGMSHLCGAADLSSIPENLLNPPSLERLGLSFASPVKTWG